MSGFDASSIVSSWIAQFAEALGLGEGSAVADSFLPDSFWRDLVACTWSVGTVRGGDAIGVALAGLPDDLVPQALAVEPGSRVEVVDRPRLGASIEAFLVFTTAYARGRGYLRLRENEASGDWKAWTFLTTMLSITGHEEQIAHRRPSGFLHSLGEGSSWLEQRQAALSYEDHDPAVVVIGGGHSGLAVAARLTVLGVDTVVIERNEHIGDNWRNRYRTLYLHNEVWTNHLPYVPYPETWPVYTSKDKLGDWLEAYAKTLDLNVWTGTTPTGATYDAASGSWEVHMTTSDGRLRTLRPRHVVLATGVFGDARELQIPGSDGFTGVIVRSQDYGFDRDSAGKKVLVIGTGSSAHDIAKDYCDNGADVTMLQRSSTTVVSVDPGVRLMHSSYVEGGRPIDDCDLIGVATPIPLARELHVDLYKRIADLDADLIAGLNEAGFRTDYGDDGSGYLRKYYERGGGYYIDVGCSQLIIDRKITIKNGVEVAYLDADTVNFTDGTEMKADVVVIAVGFANMQDSVRSLMGDEVAGRVGPVWGMDTDGELRALYRPTGQEGLWIMGGSFVQCRPMSKALAQQIVAREAGLTVPVRNSEKFVQAAS